MANNNSLIHPFVSFFMCTYRVTIKGTYTKHWIMKKSIQMQLINSIMKFSLPCVQKFNGHFGLLDLVTQYFMPMRKRTSGT